MRYFAVACDYDGTLAAHGTVEDHVLVALERLKNSGRRLVLVTGREMDDLQRVFPRTDLFDRIVAENGAVLYRPAERELRELGSAPPERFVGMLRDRGVTPLSVGRVIVATWEPNETTVLAAIRDLGLELQVVFNKGAVMVLPSGVNKATGLKAALDELKISRHNTVGIGDAENDHAFLSICECSVAVANALPMVREQADYVTGAPRGAGVVELVDRLLADDLRVLEPALERHLIPIGTREDGVPFALRPYGASVMIAGPSGSGKSTLATTVLEQLIEREYQFCLIDPEGDYSTFERAIVLGDTKTVPPLSEVTALLERRQDSVVVDLLGLSVADRPPFFDSLLAQLVALRGRTGRPHWIVLDEAHHLLPRTWIPPSPGSHLLGSALLVTVHPEHVARAVLDDVDVLLAVGDAAVDTIRAFGGSAGVGIGAERPNLEPGEALAWSRDTGEVPQRIRSTPTRGERQRHRRKYAEGTLGPDKSFYFRGAENKLQLRAQNLSMFVQLAEGIDDETWLHHLRLGDYSAWLRDSIKDEELADEVARVERREGTTAAESRSAIVEGIGRRYTDPA
jgi:HAD superfamily hydrolase (TIGR01484 family)